VGLLDPWRQEPVTFTSPLPVEIAEQRLATLVLPRSQMIRQMFTANVEDGAVFGTASGHRVKLRPTSLIGGRNSFRPELRAWNQPTSEGCQLSGTLGPPPQGVAVGVLLGVVLAIFFVIGLSISVSALVSGDWRGLAAGLAFVAGTGAIFPAFLLTMAAAAAKAGQRDRDYLDRWLGGRLHMTRVPLEAD
jgi:hypothetical protein